MKRKGLYGVVAIIGYFIRQFLLPNPFGIMKYGELYNYFIDGIIMPVAYLIVARFYSGGLPILGSLLYLFVYTVIHFELFAAFHFYPNWWIVAAIGIVFCIVDYLVVKLLTKLIDRVN